MTKKKSADFSNVRAKYVEAKESMTIAKELFGAESKSCEFREKNPHEHAFHQFICKHTDTRSHVCVFGQCPIIMGFAK